LEKSRAGKSREEIFYLRRQFVRGRRAKEQLIEAHLNMVVDQARRLIDRGLELADLVQEGNRGLMKAVEKYDGSYANGFRAYAQLYIHQRMSRAIANKARAIRVPVNVLADREKLDAAWYRYWYEHQQSPTLEDWSAYSKIAKNRIFLAYSIPDEPISLNVQVGEDEEELGDVINLYDEVDLDQLVLDGQLPEVLRLIFGTLHPREAGVIKLRFGIDVDFQHTLDEIGDHFGVTRERIRQIEAKTMSKLRHPLRSSLLRQFVDFE
jgi:RNA polymerase primary sigma factor